MKTAQLYLPLFISGHEFVITLNDDRLNKQNETSVTRNIKKGLENINLNNHVLIQGII